MSDTNTGFKLLFESLPGLVVALSPDLRIVGATNSFLKATHTTGKIIDKLFFNVFQPRQIRSQLQTKANLEKALILTASGKTQNKLESVRYDIKWPNTLISKFEERYWNFIITPVLNDAHELTYILFEAQDITLRMQEEHRAKLQHTDPAVLAKLRTGVIWECDENTRIITWSNNYRDLFGYSDKDLIATKEDWAKRVHPEDLTELEESMAATMKAGSKVWTKEYRYRKADDTYTTVLDHAFIVYNDKGEAVYSMGSIMDQSRQIEQEKLLNQANERYRLVAMTTSDVIWEWDLRRDSMLWNEGFFRLFGYKESDVEANLDFWADRVHPVDYKRVQDSLYHTINTQTTNWQETYRFRCANGSYKLVHDKGRLLYDEEGLPDRMIGSIVDITEEKKQKEEIQQQMTMIKKVLDSLPFMIWTATPDGSISYNTVHWFNHTGINSEELKGWNWSKVIHPEDYEITLQRWMHAIKTGTPFETKNRWRSANGEYRWLKAHGLPVHDQKGNVTMWVGYHTPISGQPSTSSLQDNNDFTHYIDEDISQMVWSTAPDGTTTYFNRCWHNYTGLQPNESLKMGWQSVAHPDDLHLVMPHWEETLKSGAAFETEMRFREGATSNYKWFKVKAVPIRNDHGEILKWFAICFDINNYKHSEQLLRHNYDQFYSSVNAISESIKLSVSNISSTFDKLRQALAAADNEAVLLLPLYKQSLKHLQTLANYTTMSGLANNAEQPLETIDLKELTVEVLQSMADTIEDTQTDITYNYGQAPTLLFQREILRSMLQSLLTSTITAHVTELPIHLTLTTTLQQEFVALCLKRSEIVNNTPDGLFIDLSKNKIQASAGRYITQNELNVKDRYSSGNNKTEEETIHSLYFRKKNV